MNGLNEETLINRIPRKARGALKIRNPLQNSGILSRFLKKQEYEKAAPERMVQEAAYLYKIGSF
ncbi:MAG: hypothetical protein IPI11_12570 [Haliscomenobacter sp.]|nr:hypothetical protein [Haliscomenobacter sp.]